MTYKSQHIFELANQTAQSVTRDLDDWKRYLGTAARLYNDVCCKG